MKAFISALSAAAMATTAIIPAHADSNGDFMALDRFYNNAAMALKAKPNDRVCLTAEQRMSLGGESPEEKAALKTLNDAVNAPTSPAMAETSSRAAFKALGGYFNAATGKVSKQAQTIANNGHAVEAAIYSGYYDTSIALSSTYYENSHNQLTATQKRGIVEMHYAAVAGSQFFTYNKFKTCLTANPAIPGVMVDPREHAITMNIGALTGFKQRAAATMSLLDAAGKLTTPSFELKPNASALTYPANGNPQVDLEGAQTKFRTIIDARLRGSASVLGRN